MAGQKKLSWGLLAGLCGSIKISSISVIITGMSKIPNYIKKYLWDVNCGNLDLENHGKFICERVMEYGDEQAWQWLRGNYSDDFICKVLCESRVISPKTANFYAKLLGVKESDIRCLCEPFERKQDRF